MEYQQNLKHNLVPLNNFERYSREKEENLRKENVQSKA